MARKRSVGGVSFHRAKEKPMHICTSSSAFLSFAFALENSHSMMTFDAIHVVIANLPTLPSNSVESLVLQSKITIPRFFKKDCEKRYADSSRRKIKCSVKCCQHRQLEEVLQDACEYRDWHLSHADSLQTHQREVTNDQTFRQAHTLAGTQHLPLTCTS